VIVCASSLFALALEVFVLARIKLKEVISVSGQVVMFIFGVISIVLSYLMDFSLLLSRSCQSFVLLLDH